MAAFCGFSRQCCTILLCVLCGLRIFYASAQESIRFTEPTQCSSDCSFINSIDVQRECRVQQVAFHLPTSQKCSELLPAKFFANQKDIPVRFGKNDVNGSFSQPSLNDALRVKIDVRISGNSHNRINGIFFEVVVNLKVRYCYLLDFNGTLKMNDIMPTYATGGDRILSFYPCLKASKSSPYTVVGYPLPLLNEPTDKPRINYQDYFTWDKWQIDQCKADAASYLDDGRLTIGFGRLELKINSSSLFNHYCPLGFTIQDVDNKKLKRDVSFTDGVAMDNEIVPGSYKLKFFLRGNMGKNKYIPHQSLGVTMKEKCLSFPCGISAVCNQSGRKVYNCSCPQGQTLKEKDCYAADPCLNAPCGAGGTCRRIETNSSIYHTCSCYRGFYAAHDTCMADPCNDNPCGNGRCSVNVSTSGIYRTCNCSSGFHASQDAVCRADPCFNNPCGSGECVRMETDDGFDRMCQCDPGFYASKNTGMCKPDPCFGNPCSNGTCIISETNAGTTYNCDCNSRFYATQGTCKLDPCYTNPCTENGKCVRTESESDVARYSCQCLRGFFPAHDTCKTDPCYNNPCGNGSCTVVQSATLIHHSCECNRGFYDANDTCKKDYCYGNECHPGNCTDEGNGYSCSCPTTHISAEGKCLKYGEGILEVAIGVTGGLIGVVLILIILVAKRRHSTTNKPGLRNEPTNCHIHEGGSIEDGVEGADVHKFDNDMLGKLVDRFWSLSSSEDSDNRAKSDLERETARVDSLTESHRPLLIPRGCNGLEHPKYPNPDEPSTSRLSNGCHLQSQVDHRRTADVRPCSCSSTDSSSQLFCDQHSRQTSVESDPDISLNHARFYISSGTASAPEMESSI